MIANGRHVYRRRVKRSIMLPFCTVIQLCFKRFNARAQLMDENMDYARGHVSRGGSHVGISDSKVFQPINSRGAGPGLDGAKEGGGSG